MFNIFICVTIAESLSFLHIDSYISEAYLLFPRIRKMVLNVLVITPFVQRNFGGYFLRIRFWCDKIREGKHRCFFEKYLVRNYAEIAYVFPDFPTRPLKKVKTEEN